MHCFVMCRWILGFTVFLGVDLGVAGGIYGCARSEPC